MTDKKFTEEEIIKALEYCNADRNECDKCVLQRECESNPFYSAIAEHALDLINRQKIFIESQNQLISELVIISKNANAKTKAYKKFTEKIKKEIENAYNNNSNVLHEHMLKHVECPNYEFIATVLGKMNTLQGLDDFIDNLLKEMIGEEK